MGFLPEGDGVRRTGFFMRVVVFANETEQYAGVRHRALWYARRLADDGHTVRFCPTAPVSWWHRLYRGKSRISKLLYLLLVVLRRAAQLRHVPGADVVFLKGPLFLYGPPVLERIVRLLNPRMVFDMDDALWERPAYVDSPFAHLIDYAWPRKMAALARHAVAGNRVIEAYLRRHGARAVTVIPTCVDPAHYTQKTYPARREGEAVVLGWTGIRDNLGYLRTLGEVLAELSKELPLELLVVSDGALELPGVKVVNRPWTAEGELAALQDPDIGLMPLEDTPRARGKCAFKALQYMCAGTPVILSPVGMNTEVVEDGVSGFLADTPEQWKERIRALAADPALRERMGRAGRARAREAYSFETHYPRFLETLRSVAEDAGR